MMISKEQVSKLLNEQVLNPDTQWSLGTFGAIAEFSRDPTEAVKISTSDPGISAVTGRGGLTIHMVEELRLFASESITRLNWAHRVALCLPRSACAMNRRSVLTELGPDTGALRVEDRGGVLFDLGLDALQADLCVRLADEATVAQLREHVGGSVFEPGNPAMGIILASNPHRVFISRVGRLEVYQPIPPANGKSPEGPHTHVLPKLLKAKRTHPATELIPTDWVPCAHFYPAHPLKDSMGEPRPFDQARHEAFQRMLDAYGSPAGIDVKGKVVAAIAKGQPPSISNIVVDRVVRTHIRVALRQLKALQHPSPVIPAWLEAFDRLEVTEEDEDERQHGH
jgi:hypothetical protein